MNRQIILLQAATILAAACMVLSGCGGKPYSYKPDHELKPGPGLFSGQDGVFTVVGSANKKAAEQKKKKVIQ